MSWALLAAIAFSNAFDFSRIPGPIVRWRKISVSSQDLTFASMTFQSKIDRYMMRWIEKLCEKNTKTYRWIDKNQNAYVNNLQQHAPKVWMLFSWIWTWESPSCLLVARNSPPKLSSSKIFIEHLSMGDDKQLFKVPKTTKIVTKQNCFGIMFIIVLH